MTTFQSFHASAAISETTIQRFAGQVPADIVSMWRTHGTGFIGPDWFFRAVDPAHAAQMLAGTIVLPARATVLFTTALGDVVAHSNGMYWVVKARFGATDIVQGVSFPQLVRHMEDPAQRQVAWEWEPYPTAVSRTGVPGMEQCLGFVPLLTRGGSNTPDKLQLGGLYEHLAVIAQLAGPPQVRRLVEFAEPPAPVPDTRDNAITRDSLGGLGAVGARETLGTRDTTATRDHSATRGVTATRGVATGRGVATVQTSPAVDKDRLTVIGQRLFGRLVGDAELAVMDLPGNLGVCVMHQARGGGKIYVAPDETVLFVSSAADFETGLGAFRDGMRTPLEKFGVRR